MSKQAVTVSVAGHAYRLVTSLDAAALQRHAKDVERRLGKLAPGQQIHPQALLLVALSLAHELEAAGDEMAALKERASARILDMVQRVDNALDHLDEEAEPLDGSVDSEGSAAFDADGLDAGDPESGGLDCSGPSSGGLDSGRDDAR